MQFNDHQIFFKGPLALHDVRVQMVVPALTTLLSDAPWEALGNLRPVFGALTMDNSDQDLVFLFRPGALCEVATVVQFEPACVALDLRLFHHQFADPIPRILAEFFNIVQKLFVLFETKREG